MTDGPATRWQAASGGRSGAEYAARFRRRAASGCDMHGEADFVTRLAEPGIRVLDAGCGTGRVAWRLAEFGYLCTGIDSDASMLEAARAAVPEPAGPAPLTSTYDVARRFEDDHSGAAPLIAAVPEWLLGDLADPEIMSSLTDFDVVLAAGNVIPLVAPGTEPTVVGHLAAALKPGGLLVAGFGLDAAHLPLAEAPFGLAAYDRWCAAAGLALVRRHPAWDAPAAGPGDDLAGYAVSVHRL